MFVGTIIMAMCDGGGAVMAIFVQYARSHCVSEGALYQNLRQQVVYLKYTFTLLHAIYLNYVLIIHHLYVHVPCYITS